MKEWLSSEDLERIRQAVAEAERLTSGEIVPYVVPRSDTYDGIAWKGAGIAAALALAFTAVVFQFYEGWGLGWLHTGWGTATLALAAGIGRRGSKCFRTAYWTGARRSGVHHPDGAPPRDEGIR